MVFFVNVFIVYVQYGLLRSMNLFDACSAAFYEVHLRSRDGGCGDESAVLGADERQIALGHLGAVLSCLELALEATHTGD